MKKRTEVLSAGTDKHALVPTNPDVQRISTRLRWKPETAIDRIKRALPSLVEQQIYLATAPSLGESALLPESMAKLLRLYLGNQNLQLEDLKPGSHGRSRFTSFAEYLGECINLLKVVTKEFSSLSLKIEHAGLIVLQYGNDNPERLIEMVDCNLEEVCEVIGISNNIGYEKRMAMCISVVVQRIIPMNRKSGSPDLLDLTDFLNMNSASRHSLRRALCQEVPDYLSADTCELRGYESLHILKEEGII